MDKCDCYKQLFISPDFWQVNPRNPGSLKFLMLSLKVFIPRVSSAFGGKQLILQNDISLSLAVDVGLFLLMLTFRNGLSFMTEITF